MQKIGYKCHEPRKILRPLPAKSSRAKEKEMGVHTIKKGLDLPITGKPAPRVEDGRSISRVGVVAPDYPLMKPRMHVNVGDSVQCGQVIFEDRKSEGVVFTAPAEGSSQR